MVRPRLRRPDFQIAAEVSATKTAKPTIRGSVPAKPRNRPTGIAKKMAIQR
jgi:hypothetical protein